MSLDFTEKKSYSAIEAGEYEAYIDNAEIKTSQTGKHYIALTFIIRGDVDQPYKGRRLWENIWENDVYVLNGKRIKKEDYQNLKPKDKEQVNISTEYSDFKIRNLIQAQDADEENWHTKFENMDEVVLFLNQMNLRIKVNKVADNSTGVEKNEVDFKGLKRTAVVSMEKSRNLEKVDEDDLPF